MQDGREYELGDQDRAEIAVMLRHIDDPKPPSYNAFSRECNAEVRRVRRERERDEKEQQAAALFMAAALEVV